MGQLVCRYVPVLAHPFAYDALNQTKAIVDAWAVVTVGRCTLNSADPLPPRLIG
jgi:hypothetical protein